VGERVRLLRGGLRVVAAGALAVALGVAVNQVLNGGRWNLRWLVAAVAIAVLSEALNRWLGTHGGDHAPADAASPTLWADLAAEDGTPRLLCEVTPRHLGVHPSRFGADGDSPYVRRQADDLLAAILADDEKRVIIVEGLRLAGATRTLAHAAQARLSDHLAAGFADDPRVPLADMIAQTGRWAVDGQAKAAGAVVWLDGLSPDRLGELARIRLDELPPGVRVLATFDTGQLEGLRIPEQLNTQLDRYAIRVRLGVITEQERRDLQVQDVYATLRPLLEDKGDLLLGRLMVAWEPLRAALARGGSEQAVDRIALLRAVTDWYRVHLPRLLSHDVLIYLYRAYHRELAGAVSDSPVSAAGFSDALQWATATPAADRPRLIDLQDVPGGQRYAPHPLLTVIADDPHEEVSWPVSDVLWSYADNYFRGDQRRDIGYSALAQGARHAAARLLSHSDTKVAPDAYGQIAELFYAYAEWANSRDWWQRTISTGHPDQAPKAMLNLGVLERQQGNLDEARHWDQQAIDIGHPDEAPRAMFNLGVLEYEQGNLDQSRRWWRQAADTSHPDQAPKAMFNLGILEREQGNLDEARRWWREAIGTGHPDQVLKAIVSLGVLEREQGNLDEARRCYQQAIDTGHPDEAPRAMFNLGVLEYEQGNLDQSRRWWRQAADTSHPDQAPKAMFNLGSLEYERGNLDEARRWYQQAIGTGHPDLAPQAMFNLGSLEYEQGNLDQARYSWRQAIGTGHPNQAPQAMNNLGNLEREQGNLDQARRWYHQAVGTGHPDQAPRAMFNLGNLKAMQGNLDQARRWYHQAVGTGHPDLAPKAMINLGSLEREQGNLDEARRWWRQVIGTGHPEITSLAEQGLRALDRHETDRQRAEQFGRFGYLAYADPALMELGYQAPEIPGLTVVDHASEPATDSSSDDYSD
jgi:TolA-binding protein